MHTFMQKTINRLPIFAKMMFQNQPPLIIDFKIALEKAAKYCAYQERCQFDLERKFKDWNVDNELWDEIIVEMIQQNFLNEERFSQSYTNGKVNIKRWGRQKIKNELKSRQISDYCIRKAFENIDKEKYLLNLQYLIQQKSASISAKNDYEKRMKLIQYLMGRGYELELINEELDNYGITR
jgi:regulatory protein